MHDKGLFPQCQRESSLVTEGWSNGIIPEMEYTRETLLNVIQTGLEKRSLSISALEKRAGVPKDTVRDFLRAKTHILRADKLQKIMEVLAPKSKLSVGYQLAADAELLPLPETNSHSVDFPPGVPTVGLEALLITSTAMMPVFHPGWVLYFQTKASRAKLAIKPATAQVPYPVEDDAHPYATLLGKPCVVKLADGKLMLRTLKQGDGPQVYTLVGYNTPDIHNVSIADAYKVVFIKTD